MTLSLTNIDKNGLTMSGWFRCKCKIQGKCLELSGNTHIIQDLKMRKRTAYCEFCDILLVSSSEASRTKHRRTEQHKANKRKYYSQFLEEDVHTTDINVCLEA